MSATTYTVALIREQILKLIQASKLAGQEIKQSHIANAIDMSPTVISTFLNDDYKGDVQAVCRKLTAYLAEQKAKAETDRIVLPYIETPQTKAVLQTCDLAFIQKWMTVIIGDSGNSKTLGINEYLRRHPATLVVRTWATDCASSTLRRICRELGQNEKGQQLGLTDRIVYALTRPGTDRIMIIDDAHDLAPKAFHLIRNIHDYTGIGIVLAGGRNLESKIAGTNPEQEQIARRIVYRTTLPEFSEAHAKLQIGKTLPHLDTTEVLALFDPRRKSSPARIANVMQASGEAAGGLKHVTLDDIKMALRKVA